MGHGVGITWSTWSGVDAVGEGAVDDGQALGERELFALQAGPCGVRCGLEVGWPAGGVRAVLCAAAAVGALCMALGLASAAAVADGAAVWSDEGVAVSVTGGIAPKRPWA